MTEKIKGKIIESLKEVYDPEIPINIYDLGLIYEINVKKSGFVKVVMTLTSPTCPTAEFIKGMVHESVLEVEGVKDCEIELTFEPKWTPEMVSKEARDELGLGEEDPNVGMQSMLDSRDLEEEKVCFNCSATQDMFPLVEGFYKNERIWICTKCLGKFK